MIALGEQAHAVERHQQGRDVHAVLRQIEGREEHALDQQAQGEADGRRACTKDQEQG